MRKLRIFIVELVLVAILVGWYIWKFPETLDPLIPWILWAIFAHLTWEVVLERDAVKVGVARIGTRYRRMAWLPAFVVGGVISIGYLYVARKSVANIASYAKAHTPSPVTPQTVQPASTQLAPAGFISFVGAVVDGEAQLMQENQTETPLDDVRLQIIAWVPKSADDWSTGTTVWDKTIDIGTCRARLTTSLPVTLPVGDHERLMVQIFMLTRLQSYTENIKLTRTSKTQYVAEHVFQPNTPLAYTKNTPLSIVSMKNRHLPVAPVESRSRELNAEALGKKLASFKGVTVAVWDDGTNEPGALAKQIEIGLGMAHALLRGGGQKMADAAWFPDSLTIEISSKSEPSQEQAHKAATELHDVLKNDFRITSQIRYTDQEFPENFMRIKVASR